MIIDAHFHFGYIEGYMNYDTSLAGVMGVMDQLGIQYAVNSNTRDLMFGDYEAAAAENIQLYHETGGRIMSYFAYNPYTAELCLDVIRRYHDEKVFKGIKIHPSWHLAGGDDVRYEAVWRYASENGLVLIAHTWDKSLTNPVQELSFPTRFEHYLQKYPDTRFICAHSGGRYNGIVAAVDMAQKYPNMYLDTAGDIYAYGYLEYAVAGVGSKKILFGSDYSMMDQRNMLGIVLGANISPVDRENILCANAAALFNLCNTTEGVSV